MPSIFADQNSSFDGSGSPSTATQSIQLQVSGEFEGSVFKLYVDLSGTGDFTKIYSSRSPDVKVILMANGMDWYVALDTSDAGDSATRSVSAFWSNID